MVAAPAQHLHSKHSWKGASLLLHKSTSPFLPAAVASIGRNPPAAVLDDVLTGEEASTANIVVAVKAFNSTQPGPRYETIKRRARD